MRYRGTRTFQILAIVSMLCFAKAGETAQRGSETILELRHRCVDAVQGKPKSAEGPCREYLRRVEDDNPETSKWVRDWLEAFDKVQPFVKSLLALSPSDPKRPWFVYEPDLILDIPDVTENAGNYTIELKRFFNGPAEEMLLRKAEAVYSSPSTMVETVLQDPRRWAENLPASNEPLWWSGGNDNIRLTTVVTARAVRHYADLSRELRQNPTTVSGFSMDRTSLKYQATIKHCDKYSHGEDSFTDVYVADMNLDWGHSCGSLCGMWFKRNKVVVLRASGEVLALYLDAAVNSTLTVS